VDASYRARSAHWYVKIQRVGPWQSGTVPCTVDSAARSTRTGRRDRARSERSYHLSPAGRDLQPVVFGLAEWGARWTFGEPDPDELDADLLLWWLHRRLNPDRLPGPRFVIYVHFSDDPNRYWIVVENEASLCLSDPGFDVDLTLCSELPTLYRTYLGHQTLTDAFREGQLDLSGSNAATRSFIEAFQPSPVAAIVAAAT
jgi:hypothetical protein